LKQRKGGLTNKEKSRHKPIMMSMHSQGVRKKRGAGIKEKAQNLTKHIKTLKQKVGGKIKRRRR